jgi:uncharacterized protein YaiI (UPF0178 family)
MKILVDADACPVKDIIEELARKYDLELIMVSNINHIITSNYAKVVVVDGASQSADIAIVNLARLGDIVVTQDYGLASIALAKGAYSIHPLGKLYTEENIEGLLMERYVNQKARQARERINGPRKRKPADNSLFKDRLDKLIEECNNDAKIEE